MKKQYTKPVLRTIMVEPLPLLTISGKLGKGKVIFYDDDPIEYDDDEFVEY